MATLFYNTPAGVSYLKGIGFEASSEFVECADKQLTSFFVKMTNIRPGTNICISGDRNNFYYTKDRISEMPLLIYIRDITFPVKMRWQSKSGRIYMGTDTDIDCADLEFWFEGIDTAAYIKHAFPKNPLPFKLEGLTYALEVEGVSLDCSIDLILKKEEGQGEKLIPLIDQFIGDFNTKSEQKDRKDGVVHNWKRRFEDGALIYDLDLGSTGPVFLKKLLLFVSKMQAFEKVRIY